MKEGEEATKVTAVYDPWMPLEQLAERSRWLYSSEVARLNTIMSISYFVRSIIFLAQTYNAHTHACLSIVLH